MNVFHVFETTKRDRSSTELIAGVTLYRDCVTRTYVHHLLILSILVKLTEQTFYLFEFSNGKCKFMNPLEDYSYQMVPMILLVVTGRVKDVLRDGYETKKGSTDFHRLRN